MSLIPILLPKLRISFKKAIGLFILWIAGQGIWLYFAYKLEFLGENTFIQLWVSSLIFLMINFYVMNKGFIDCYDYEMKKIKIKKRE